MAEGVGVFHLLAAAKGGENTLCDRLPPGRY